MHGFRPSEAHLRTFSHKLLLLRNRHFLLIDLLIFCITPGQALILRTDRLTNLYAYGFSLMLYGSLALIVRLLIFYKFGLYRRFWRYASSAEIGQVVKAMLVATSLIGVCFWLANDQITGFDLPRSLPLIDALLALSLVTASRASIRLTESWRRAQQREGAQITNIVIMGAGHTGELIAREIQNNSPLNMCIIAFLDDDITKHGMQIHNIPVLGGRTQLQQIVEEQKVDRVIIAMPAAPGREVRQMVELCRRLGVKTQTMPGIHELLSSNININHLRNVQIEDLLRREPIKTDTAAVNELVQGKCILITGGGGSIGSELCRQILRYKPAHLILLGHGENSVFSIHNELQRIQVEVQEQVGNTLCPTSNSSHGATLITPIIADLRFAERLRSIFAQYRPQIVFHAAAHKHVPLMEAHPSEAITNNVLGTKNLLDAAQASGIERFVMISTDKAVNPTSIMGASKRTAELLVHQAAERSGQPYMIVRFGNVLGSRGSVVHTFKQQIALGGPVTVTHPDMVRYFMTIPEAVQLLLQASVLGHGGEAFMLDMGEPVKIVDLARDLIELSGLTVGRDIEISYSGIRPGEKLFEEMFTPGETYARTQHAKVLMAANASRFVPVGLDETINALIADACRNDEKAIIRGLKNLLPEYHSTSFPTTGAALPSASLVQADKTKPSVPLALEPLLSNGRI
ncbi:nucleoside-diphosphate sugar epimerase/dehydratase [soil metagenome]